MTETIPASPSVPRLIERKRDGKELARHEIDLLLDRYLAGDVPDYQMSALLMAIYFRGLTDAELEAWTACLVQSGQRWDFREVPGPKVDKHSTGGVGDKVSLVLAPLLAALGLKVPMVSGRGLGHTGGTLDKLESIPGFRTSLNQGEFERLLSEVGYAMGGQTGSFAPLDRELYALRDVTATVESLPLIAASIMSKKIAEGLDALVLDVKTGRGAFLSDPRAAEDLALTMIALGRRFGLPSVALLTDMDQPLGRTVGNALEVREAIETLRGQGPHDLVELTVALAATLLVMVGKARDEQEGREAACRALEGGSALESFRRSVEAQGGDSRVVDRPDRLPHALVTLEARSPRSGWICALDARRVGRLVVALGGGRRKKAEVIDPSVGLVLHRKVGDEVAKEQPLATVHAAHLGGAEAAGARLAGFYEIGPEPPAPHPLVLKRIGG